MASIIPVMKQDFTKLLAILGETFQNRDYHNLLYICHHWELTHNSSMYMKYYEELLRSSLFTPLLCHVHLPGTNMN